MMARVWGGLVEATRTVAAAGLVLVVLLFYTVVTLIAFAIPLGIAAVLFAAAWWLIR